jgi:hypothetical protein
MDTEGLREIAKERILKDAPKMHLSCRKAFAIAEDTGLPPAELGKLCNELKVKIMHCQLGCF